MRFCLALLLITATAWSDGYDVFATLRDTGPHQSIILDSSLTVTFGRTATTLSSASGKPAGPGEVLIKRRFPLVEVSQRGELLLRTWSRTPLTGEAIPGKTAHLADFRIQPVADVCFDDDFFKPDGTAQEWEPLSGSWKVGIYRDALWVRDHGDKAPIFASWYETQGAHRAVSVCGYDWWDAYRARVAVQASATARVGLIFWCRDKNNYMLLSVGPGKTPGRGTLRFSQVRDGKEEDDTFGSDNMQWQPGNWYELAMAAHDGRFQCFINGHLFLDGVSDWADGRVGVFADGPGVARFDDMQVRSLHTHADRFDRPRRGCPAGLGAAWETFGGSWYVAGDQLEARSSQPARCLRVEPAWPATRAAAQVSLQSGSAGLCLNWTGRSGYALSVTRDEYTILKFIDGKKTVLARQPITRTRFVPCQLEYDRGRLDASVDRVEQTVYDFDLPTGRCGLFVEGEAVFQSFEDTEPPSPGTTIASVTGTPATVPGEGEGTSRPVLGYVWHPRNGQWSPTDLGSDSDDQHNPGLGARPSGGDPAELWYYQSCLGDATLTAARCTIPANGVLGLALSCEGESVATGYAFEASASGTLKLMRQGVTVAEGRLSGSRVRDLSLWRDGAYVVGAADAIGISFKDPSPLTGGRCAAYARGQGTIGSLTLGHRQGRYYSFKEVETDWQPAEGDWFTHSGMACIAWDYWLTAKAAPRAFAYNASFSDNVQADLWISEYTEGFADGRHVHYPYHDVSLITSAATRSADSGYRFIIGANGGTVTRLLRLGQIVAETRAPCFAITMGSHCNSPRAIHVVATQRNGDIVLRLNDLEALRYTDPQPLPGGLVGIGAEGCSVDFRDFWLAPTGPG